MTMANGATCANILETSLASRRFFRSRALWLLLITFVPISPFFSGILGVPIAVSHVALCVIAILIFGVNFKSNIFKFAIIFIVYQIVLSIVTHQSGIYLKQSIAIFLCLLFASNLTLRDLNLFESLLRKFLMVGLFLSYISFIAMIVAPVADPYSFPNPDGRFNYIFYFTFSNYQIGSFIRPAFVFDEPGAFATIIGLWVLLAYSLKRFDGRVLAIAALGLITQSLALFIFVLVMLLQLRPRTLTLTAMLFGMLVLIYFALPDEFKVFTFLLGRLDDGALSFNSRLTQVLVVVNNLDIYLFFLGAKAVESSEFIEMVGDVSSNPLTPLFNFGLFQSVFFYLGIAVIFHSALKHWKHAFALLGFVSLLFQRPYYADVGYSMLILIVFFLLVIPRWFNFYFRRRDFQMTSDSNVKFI
jgi:hypothetical protein